MRGSGVVDLAHGKSCGREGIVPNTFFYVDVSITLVERAVQFYTSEFINVEA